MGLQHVDGHFVFELEADATIPAEYVLMRHYLGEPVDAAARGEDRHIPAPHPIPRRGLAAFSRGPVSRQRDLQGYFALKMIGDRGCPAYGACSRLDSCAREELPTAMSSRETCSHSMAPFPGAGFPLCQLRSCCCRGGFLSTSTRSPIGRERCLCPLTVLNALKPRARNPKGRAHRRTVRHAPQSSAQLAQRPASDLALVGHLRRHRPHPARARAIFSKTTRRLAIERARRFVTERLNGDDGLGRHISRRWPTRY